MRPTAAEIAAQLGLEPHPEGGWFRETYRAAQEVRTARGPRPASTSILFLVTPGSPSRFHRLASDELWVFQGGDPLELLTLEAGGVRRRALGDPAVGLLPQALVPAGVWQAARVAPAGDVAAAHASAADAPASRAQGDAWSLASCVVTPGFVYEDFELARRDELTRRYPAHAALVAALT